MIEPKTSEKYVFPEFARGTLIEHLENRQDKLNTQKIKTAPSFWNTLAIFLSEKQTNVNL